jgi:hypothetical protein
VSLTRVYTALNNLIIRNLGDTGGPSSSRVDEELNNIIAWAKLSPRVLVHDFPSTPVGNTGAGPDTLHSYSLPAGSLATNGDFLRVTYTGLFAGDNDTKTIAITFDSQVVSALAQAQAPTSWKYNIILGRVTDTTVRFGSDIHWGRLRVPNGGALLDEGLFAAEQGLITVADMDVNALTLLLVGGDAGSETNDVQYSQAVVELFQQ